MKINVTVLFLCLFAFHVSAGAQEKILLQLEGIKGSSVERGYRGWIDVESYSFGTSTNWSDPSTPRGGSKPSVIFQDISFVKFSERSSIDLLRHAIEGKQISKAAMHFLKTQQRGSTAYLKIELTGVGLTTFQHSGGSGDGQQVVEQLSLIFDTISFKYFDENGKETGTFGWDRVTGQRIPQ